MNSNEKSSVFPGKKAKKRSGGVHGVRKWIIYFIIAMLVLGSIYVPAAMFLQS
jgi:hypothetical protein